jgi:hypothetical protein
MTRTQYGKELREYYDFNRIGVHPQSPIFGCRYFDDCQKATQRKLRPGAEAHVGKKYGDPVRLLVISLDTGGGGNRLQGEHLLERCELIESIKKVKANPHMRGTISLLENLIRPAVQDFNLLQHFAMINAAKCAGYDDDKSMVPALLYQKCREFALGEISILDPQVIVTQGVKARDVLGGMSLLQQDELHHLIPIEDFSDFHVKQWITDMGKYCLRWWQISPEKKKVLARLSLGTRQLIDK